VIERPTNALRPHVAAMTQDIRHAWRSIRRSPGFTAIAVAMLALGTGANTALFSVVEGVMLRSPFDRPDAIAWVSAREAGGRTTMAVSRDAYDRLGRLPLFDAVALVGIGSPVATGIDAPRRLLVECVPASMIDVLGARPHLGRWFSAAEDRPAGPPVVVVSFRFWRRDLRGDPDVLGRTIALDGEPVSIVGVMRSGFDGVRSVSNRDMWVPLGQTTLARPRFGCRLPGDFVNAVVRLRPGLHTEQASELLNAALAADEHADGPAATLALVSLDEQVFGYLRQPFLALTGAVLAVLLIACANVTNLGLERLAGRRRSVAVRMALGASRSRIMREAVTEHVLLAVAGGIVGIMLAGLLLDGLVSLVPASVPHADQIRLNGRVLIASIGLAVAAGIGVGLIPALRAGTSSVQNDLQSAGRGSTGNSRSISRALVTTELAFGSALLVAALLMIQTFVTLRPDAPGFDSRNRMIVEAQLPDQMPLEDRERFFVDVRRAVLEVPGVRTVVGTTYVPMSRNVAVLDLAVDGTAGRVLAGTVSPGYFETMGISVVRGREFTASDGAGAAAVAVVNDAFVRRWLSDREPVGMEVELDSGSGGRTVRIAGVVGDFRSWGGDTEPRPEVYLPFGQAMLGSPIFIIEADPQTAIRLPDALRAVVSRVRPGQLVDRVERFEDVLAAEVAQPRFGAWLFGLLAALAVTLSGLGLAATLAWSVAERRREIGLRVALGADRHRVHALVFGETARMSSLGIVLGLAMAVWSTRLLQGWLYGVSPLDPLTFVACGAFMVVVALAASYVPARRAAGIDPVVALRAD